MQSEEAYSSEKLLRIIAEIFDVADTEGLGSDIDSWYCRHLSDGAEVVEDSSIHQAHIAYVKGCCSYLGMDISAVSQILRQSASYCQDLLLRHNELLQAESEAGMLYRQRWHYVQINLDESYRSTIASDLFSALRQSYSKVASAERERNS